MEKQLERNLTRYLSIVGYSGDMIGISCVYVCVMCIYIYIHNYTHINLSLSICIYIYIHMIHIICTIGIWGYVAKCYDSKHLAEATHEDHYRRKMLTHPVQEFQSDSNDTSLSEKTHQIKRLFRFRYLL